MGLHASPHADKYKGVTVLFCAGSLAMVIISFIWAIKAKDEVERLRDSMSSFVSNWETDMVFDLTLTANPTLPSNQYYVTEWKSQWPGNNEGCWCENSNILLEVKKGLKDRECNTNETLSGCKDIFEKNPQDLKKWFSNQIVYAVRANNTSFKQNYLNINSDGSCKTGFKNCGDKNSKSRGLCIPTSFTDCPITDVSSSSVAGYKSLVLATQTIYTGSPNTKNPISDLMYVQDHACFIRSHYARAPGRSKYDLLKGDHDSCIKDPSVTYLSSMGETAFLDLNAIDHKALYEFNSSNNYEYKMSAGRFVNWSPDCSDTVESLNQKSQDLKDIYNQHRMLFIIYIVSLCIVGLVFISNFLTIAAMLSDKVEPVYKTVFKYSFVARVIAWIIVVPSIIVCLAKIRQLYTYYYNIAQLGCSDDDTNNILVKVADRINTDIIKKENIVIALSFVGFFLDCVVCWLYLELVVVKGGATSESGENSKVNGSQSNTSHAKIAPANNSENASLKPSQGVALPLAKPEQMAPLPPGFGLQA